MAILIVPTRDILIKIAATPNLAGDDHVQMGVPVELADGRFAVIHPWGEVTIDWLAAYIAGIKGAEVLETDALPYPVKERLDK
ncbi:MAG: hypothetical protein VB084_06430 [Syntrophomonadaceae bacterium]|nr:hypothetical protein [Syntrophomonadaceae bacterium]